MLLPPLPCWIAHLMQQLQLLCYMMSLQLQPTCASHNCRSCRSEENAGVLEGTVVELLRAMVEEADDLPQSQLDILLTRLLPAHAAEAPASHAATKALLQRTETTVQPYLQRLLSGLLTGARTDSELRGDYHSVFYAVGGNGIVAAHWHVMGLQIVAAMMLLTFWPCWCTRVDGLVCWAVRFLN